MYKLRELEKKDLPEINRWRNDADLISKLGAPFRFINLEVDEKWYDNYMNNRANNVRCAIVNDDADNDIIGLVSLTSIDQQNGVAQLQIMIGKGSERGKGAGYFAVSEMLTHAFRNMNLHRVELAVLEDNEIARHLYEKCGFVCEGIKRNARYKEGKYVNLVFYGILREEWQNQ